MYSSFSDSFKIDGAILIAHLIASIAIIFILWRLVYRPFRHWLEKRQKFYETQKAQANDFLLSSEKLKKQAQENLQKTERVIAELVANTTKESEKIKQNILRQAEHESQDLLLQSQRKSEQIMSDAEAEIKKAVVENAILLTEKILKEKISIKEQQKLIDEFIDNLNEK